MDGIRRSLAFVLVLLALLSLAGCGSPEEKVAPGQVVQDAVSAWSGVSTTRVEITENATARGTWDGAPVNARLDGTGSGDIDFANHRMKAHLGGTVNHNGHAFPVAVDVCAVDNYSYTRVTLASMADEWRQLIMPADLWLAADNAELIGAILESGQAESLEDEEVAGKDCYVVDLAPDIAAVQQALGQQPLFDGGLPDLSRLIKDLSLRVWVAKDTSHFARVEMDLSARVTPEALGRAPGGDALDVTLRLTVEPANLDEPVSVEAPARGGLATSRVEITGSATVQGNWGGSPISAALSAAVRGDVDWVNKKLKAHLDATPSLYFLPLPVSADMYVVDNYSYTQVAFASIPGGWSRSDLPADFWPDADDIRLVNRVLEGAPVQFLAGEKVDGTDCYVVQFVPDIAATQQMLTQHYGISGTLPDMARIINSLSIRVWIAKDTSYFTKIQITSSGYLTPEALGSAANGDALTVSLDVTIRIKDFNEAVSIELPAEALALGTVPAA